MNIQKNESCQIYSTNHFEFAKLNLLQNGNKILEFLLQCQSVGRSVLSTPPRLFLENYCLTKPCIPVSIGNVNSVHPLCSYYSFFVFCRAGLEPQIHNISIHQLRRRGKLSWRFCKPCQKTFQLDSPLSSCFMEVKVRLCTASEFTICQPLPVTEILHKKHLC